MQTLWRATIRHQRNTSSDIGVRHTLKEEGHTNDMTAVQAFIRVLPRDDKWNRTPIADSIALRQNALQKTKSSSQPGQPGRQPPITIITVVIFIIISERRGATCSVPTHSVVVVVVDVDGPSGRISTTAGRAAANFHPHRCVKTSSKPSRAKPFGRAHREEKERWLVPEFGFVFLKFSQPE